MKTQRRKNIACMLAATVLLSAIPFQTFGAQTMDKRERTWTASSTMNVMEEENVAEPTKEPETTAQAQETDTTTGDVSTKEPATDDSTKESVTDESTQQTTEQESTTLQPTTPETTQEPTTEVPTTPIPTTEVPTTKKTAWGKGDGVYYNDKLKPIPNAVAKGLDVSHHQGKIDWAKVSKSDIDFVIIRCGYGDNITSQDDKFFAQNVAGCEKYNIPYGVYIYSYAKSVKQSRSEADHVLRLLKATGAKPTYPIYIDYEDSSQNSLTPKQLGDMATAFFNKTIVAGYKAGVYANLNWWKTKLTDKRFDQWTKWVAQYNSVCSFAEKYQIWQSTSVGKVSGVSGDADLNFLMQYDCAKDSHVISQWVTTKASTVFAKGTQMRICSVCGEIQNRSTAKVKATGKLNKTKLTLKYKQKYKKLKVSHLASGDKVKSYTSSNKKIVTVSKKGVITAKKKKGKATVTVTLKSGKKLKVKVTVKRK